VQRTTRGVTLTTAGDAALRYAERVLALVDELTEHTRAPVAAGRYRLGLLEDIAVGGLPEVLADFAAVHPGAVLDVIVSGSADLRAQLDSGSLDLAIGDPDVISAAASVPCRRGLFRLEWVAHPRFDHTIDPLPVVLFAPPCAWRDALLDALAGSGRRWRSAFESSSLSAVHAAVRAGLGLTALLAGTVQPGMTVVGEPGGLPDAPSIELALYRRRGLPSTPTLDRLEELLWRAIR
jgi:DNA-binding transcriptional LysR family regulator